MTIKNDQITLTAEDFDGLSDFAKKALEKLFQKSAIGIDGNPPEPGDYAAEFSTILSNYVSRAKAELKASVSQEEPVAVVLESYANADEAKRKSAEPLLADLDNPLKS